MREEYDFSCGKRGAVISSPTQSAILVLVSAAAFAAEKHRNQRRKDTDAIKIRDLRYPDASDRRTPQRTKQR
jgi:hypothetical protein